MILNAGSEITLQTDASVALILMLRPLSGLGQQVQESSVIIEPWAPFREYIDSFGNACQRVLLEPGPTRITNTCTVSVSDEMDVHTNAGFTLVQDLPDDVLVYLLPSRYCQSDMMLKLATSIAGNADPGYGQVEAIRHWIHRKVRYKYGVSNATTSALDTAKKMKGVCRDFAHLGISLCRALRIPARMVSGYLYQLDPMDMHAWFEAYIGGRWYTVDATQSQPRGNRIVLCYGRDAADIAQLSEYGPITMGGMNSWVNMA